MADQRMTAEEFARTWAHVAQIEAEQGILTCRVCKQQGPVEEAITIWRNGAVLYGICDRCLQTSIFHIEPTARGVEVRGIRKR